MRQRYELDTYSDSSPDPSGLQRALMILFWDYNPRIQVLLSKPITQNKWLLTVELSIEVKDRMSVNQVKEAISEFLDYPRFSWIRKVKI